MGANSKIEWTDATWNPIVGCSVVSKGCTNCYAMRTAGARTKHTAKYAGLTRPSKAGPVWTGEVRLWEKALADPLSWREPRRVFVNSMGDLFHESIPDEWIDRCFAVMALSPRHTFQILTKRPDRMRAYLTGPHRQRIAVEIVALPLQSRDDGFDGARAVAAIHAPAPLPNIWLGVSAEDQERWDERKEHLRHTPAVVHFASFEPLLGGIVESRIGDYIQWAIVGGESGPKARPMHPDWARSIRDQCQAAGTAFLFKQWGEQYPAKFVEIGESGEVWRAGPDGERFWAFDELGAASPPEFRFVKHGKARAGRLLDGREWNEFPGAPP